METTFRCYLNGHFGKEYIEHQPVMTKGWKLEHETLVSRGFLALCDASYSHMGTEIGGE